MCLRTPHSVLLGKEAEETKKVPESIYSQTLCNRKNSNRSKAITDTDVGSITYLFQVVIYALSDFLIMVFLMVTENT